jgi:competence protein ComEC
MFVRGRSRPLPAGWSAASAHAQPRSSTFCRVFGLLLLAFACSTQPVGAAPADEGPARGRNTDLRVSFVDVGQGDAIWIQSPGPHSKNIIIDGGPDRGPKNRLLVYLEQYGLLPGSDIDCIVATHPHDDHYPGLMDLLAQYEVAMIIDSGFPKTGEGFAAFRRAARAEQFHGHPARFIEMRKKRETDLEWGEGVQADVLYADSATVKNMGRGNTRENNASTVIRLVFGKFSFLLMGDGEGKERKDPATALKFVEKALVEHPPDGGLKATVLKAGHHGSETGSTLPFLRLVDPKVVVVMSGRKKFLTRFLPDESVLQRYQALNPDVIVVRTDDQDEAEGHTATDDEDGDDVYIRANKTSLRIYQAVGADRRRVWRKVGEIR